MPESEQSRRDTPRTADFLFATTVFLVVIGAISFAASATTYDPSDSRQALRTAVDLLAAAVSITGAGITAALREMLLRSRSPFTESDRSKRDEAP